MKEQTILTITNNEIIPINTKVRVKLDIIHKITNNVEFDKNPSASHTRHRFLSFSERIDTNKGR